MLLHEPVFTYMPTKLQENSSDPEGLVGHGIKLRL